MTNNHRKIRIAKSALKAIMKESKKSARKHLETGGALLGVRDESGRPEIRFALGPGKNAIRTAAMFEKCPVHTARKFVELRESTGLKNLMLAGDWHLHPIFSLSGGDERTLKEICASYPGYLALVVCGLKERKARLFTVENGRIVELELEVFDDAVKEQSKTDGIDYDRTKSIIDPKISSRWNILVIGAGTGGSIIAIELARFNLAGLSVGDGDRFQAVNVPRHIGRPHHLGLMKPDVVISEARIINPGLSAEAINVPLTNETRDLYAEKIRKADMVFVCSGEASSNLLAQELCIQLKTPAVLGGAFERASGGLSLLFDPEDKNGCCYNCVFDHARNLQATSNEALEHQRRDYGFSEEELVAQQGLFLDISFIAHLQAKMGLTALARKHGQNMPPLPGNLVVWSNEKFGAQWANVKQRHDCAVCNPDGWQASKQSLCAAEGSS